MTARPLTHFAPPAGTAAAWGWLAIVTVGAVGLPWEGVWRSLCLAPWCEEVVWRWGLQAPLSRRWGAAWACAVSALAFGLAHLLFARDTADAWRAAATVLPAAWIGAGFARHGRLLPCVAWHAGFNLIWMGVIAR
ncbi:CPBP family intramembrane glutamic endopeptidase [Ideonella sp. DXS29W]|uniref:CPBP family intramembrane glutamic endopeptidase n=1 Tax=Ideonella lacteola TaxID=2984193 RepID=A0ABU9BWK6_9BURK